MSENKIPEVIYILDKDLEYDLQINEVLNVEVSINKMTDNDVAYILKSKYDEDVAELERKNRVSINLAEMGHSNFTDLKVLYDELQEKVEELEKVKGGVKCMRKYQQQFAVNCPH